MASTITKMSRVLVPAVSSHPMTLNRSTYCSIDVCNNVMMIHDRVLGRRQASRVSLSGQFSIALGTEGAI